MNNLPEWRVRSVVIEVGPKYKAIPALKITCPRTDCGGVAYVSPKWAKPRVTSDDLPPVQSRACTHCFKANQIPMRYTVGRA